MSDESDPIAPPLESGPQGLDSNRPDPRTIEGEARELPPEPSVPQAPGTARAGVTPIWLLPTALVGGLIGYGLVQILNPPPDVASLNASALALNDRQGAEAARVDALAKRMAIIEPALAGAAKAGDVKGLAARLDAVEKSAADAVAAAKVAPPAAEPQPAVDLSPVNARLDALDSALKTISGKPDATQPLQEKLAALESSLAQIKAAAAPSRDGGALAALTEGLSLRFDSGAPFAGELETLKRLGADADSLAALAPMAASGAPTPQKIAAAFEAIAPSLAAAPAPAATPSPAPADQGLMGGIMARLSSLVKVRVKDAPAPDANGPSAAIRAALAKGDFAAATAAFAPLKDRAGAVGDAWLALIDQRGRALAAITKLRAEADDALKAAAP